jgi:arabinogalactan oligomer / maltooligosaccharide transport system substrate-binding protein
LGGKTIWDVLPIPIAAALIAGVFGLWQLYINTLQHHQDQLAALDQQRAAVLQTYIGNMQTLLFDKLITSKPGDEIRQLARVQTLTTLRSLNADRNETVLRFLRDAGLIGMQDPVINLSNADLSGADLEDTTLGGIDLSGTDLNGADLNGADLNGADLNGADLTGTTLSDAKLRDALLISATITGADLNDADLTGATLSGASLIDAHMDGAILTSARLNSAFLSGAELNDAHLSDADLIDADLTSSNLSGADLSDADLITAYGLSQPQLDSANLCTYAILPAGFTCHRSGTITLTYWYTETDAEAPVIGKLINQFEQQYPDIHINPVRMNYFQTEAAFVRANEEGQAPDVLRSDVGWVGQFASQGYLLNIDPYIDSSNSQVNLSDYLSGPLAYDYYGGDYYGLPQVTDFLALLYNKKELKNAGITSSPPATMTDFENDAKEVVQSKAARYGFETDGTGYNALPFLYAFGGGMFEKSGNIIINSSGSINGLQFLLNLQNNDNVMPKNVNYSIGPVSDIVADFAKGETAMIFGGPYDIPEILTGSSFKGNPGNLGIASIPTCPPGTSTCQAGQTGTPNGGQSYVISADTEHPVEAYKFISFMSSTPRQIEIAEANHTLPTRESAYQAIGVSSDRFISDFLPIASTVVDRPAIPQAGDLFDALDPNIAAALDGAESPTAALNAVADAWKQLLADP